MAKKQLLRTTFHGYRFRFDPKIHAQDCGGEQVTQPGMAMTIKEMLARSQGGQLIPLDDRLQYPEHEDDDMFQINDLTDIDDIKRHNEEALSRLEEAKKQQSEKTERTKRKVSLSKDGEEAEQSEASEDQPES